jgi:hypothetical protein
MITWGFVPSQSGVVTNNTPFIRNGIQYLSAYITVGNAGNIVWQNNQGQPQYFPNAQAGQTYLIGATQILSSATVDGNSVSTTATNLVWWAVNQLNNTP